MNRTTTDRFRGSSQSTLATCPVTHCMLRSQHICSLLLLWTATVVFPVAVQGSKAPVLVSKPAALSSTCMDEATMSPPEPEPNPPHWPDTVHILRETDDFETNLKTVKATEDGWNEEYQAYTCDHHFSSRRHALLFAPGTYRNLDWEVGYYVQVAGLGVSPDDVQFRDCEKGPHVPAVNHHVHPNGTSLDTFWRSAENFASYANKGMRWAVSQAAPLRRVHIGTDLYLFEGSAYASGGHLANAQVDGMTHFGGQQQWMSRNVHFGGGVEGGAWSLVFVGCTGKTPESRSGSEDAPSISVTDMPPVRLEKPYVAMKSDRVKFDLRVPQPIRGEKTSGPRLDGTLEDVRDFSNVFVAVSTSPASTTTTDIQMALEAGKDVVLAPGIFELAETLHVRHENQVILGLGLATLVAPSNGSPCIHVASATSGVRIAGIMLEASLRNNDAVADAESSLLEWGEVGVQDPGNATNPGGLFDIFCRVGGATTGARDQIYVDTMMRIHSGHVVGDNLWLWRADHGEINEGEHVNYPHISPLFHQSEENEFRVETGVEINGYDVVVYGLAVEHANGHQTVWNGERGEVYFYQCELPYGATQKSFGDAGFTGYLVGDHVQTHSLLGAGVYSNFRNEAVNVATAVRYPELPSVQCVNPFIVRLDNNGTIESIVNDLGPSATVKGKPVRLSRHDSNSLS